MTEPEILTFGVSETVKSSEGGIGGGGQSASGTPDDRGQAEYYERVMKYLERYVDPHKTKSRWVTKEDITRLVEEGQVMVNLCSIPRGMYGNVAAIAHPQIESKDPLRFFAMPDGLLIINPVIFKHTRDYVDKEEGCMSYPSEPMKMVQIFHKITVRYQVLSKGEDGIPVLSDPIDEGYSGNIAAVFQHEVAHLNGAYIYDEDYKPEVAIFFGEGAVEIDELTKKYDR